MCNQSVLLSLQVLEIRTLTFKGRSQSRSSAKHRWLLTEVPTSNSWLRTIRLFKWQIKNTYNRWFPEMEASITTNRVKRCIQTQLLEDSSIRSNRMHWIKTFGKVGKGRALHREANNSWTSRLTVCRIKTWVQSSISYNLMDYHRRKRKYTPVSKILSLHSKTYLERAASSISHKLSVSY